MLNYSQSGLQALTPGLILTQGCRLTRQATGQGTANANAGWNHSSQHLSCMKRLSHSRPQVQPAMPAPMSPEPAPAGCAWPAAAQEPGQKPAACCLQPASTDPAGHSWPGPCTALPAAAASPAAPACALAGGWESEAQSLGAAMRRHGHLICVLRLCKACAGIQCCRLCCHESAAAPPLLSRMHGYAIWLLIPMIQMSRHAHNVAHTLWQTAAQAIWHDRGSLHRYLGLGFIWSMRKQLAIAI